MLSNKKRITIIVISVIAGSILSALLLLSRMGSLTVREWSTIGVNFLLALIIVFGIGLLLKKISR